MQTEKKELRLTFGLALAVKASAAPVAGTHQRVAQVNALPLLVDLIVPSIVIARFWGEKEEQKDGGSRG